ncbi:MAG: P1 family peptidase [Bacilli bacterium]
MKRIIQVGSIKTGPHNDISDVPGVLVGHSTLIHDNIRTGVTAILPHSLGMFTHKVVASCYVANGFGKSTGLVQIEECSTIETPILLTNTLSVGLVADGLVRYMVEENPNIGRSQSTVNPVVCECNDGRLNDIQQIVCDEHVVREALSNATSPIIQGSVGAGAGMVCHGLKGGIGSNSRQFELDGKTYTLGVLVNSNFGHSQGKDLIVKGKAMGPIIAPVIARGEADQGSIIVVVATDVGLDAKSIGRVLKRVSIGIGRTGSYMGHGSGDVFIGFSTANLATEDTIFRPMMVLNDSHINILFQSVVEAVEEAIYQSMLLSPAVKGYRTSVHSLTEWATELP